MLAASLASKRYWLNNEEESVYVSLPYGTPSPGQYGGPPTCGGPPGSGSKRPPPLVSRHTLASIKLNFTDNISTGHRTISRDHSRRDSRDDMELTCNRLFRSYAQEQLPVEDRDDVEVKRISLNGMRLSNGFVSDSSLPLNCGLLRTVDDPDHDAISTRLSVSPGATSTGPVEPWRRTSSPMVRWGNVPETPIVDDPKAQAPVFQPPPSDLIPRLVGYENLTAFGQDVLYQPPLKIAYRRPDSLHMEFDSLPSMDAQQCKRVLMQHTRKHCCNGTRPAREATIIHVVQASNMQFSLETYSESRTASHEHEPYRGGEIDGPQKTDPLPTWRIPCQPDSLFSNHVKRVVVPHTEWLQTCHACDGHGFVRCYRCKGLGKVRCDKCSVPDKPHETGEEDTDTVTDTKRKDDKNNDKQSSQNGKCAVCEGEGTRRCRTCVQQCSVICPVCEGFRQLKCYITLSVSYTSNKSDYTLEKNSLPDPLKQLGSVLIFEQVLPQCWPISTHPVQEVNELSLKTLESHKSLTRGSKIILQRQQLRVIPVTEVHYRWHDLRDRFWVYGRDPHQRVYAPGYPHKYCCGCAIM